MTPSAAIGPTINTAAVIGTLFRGRAKCAASRVGVAARDRALARSRRVGSTERGRPICDRPRFTPGQLQPARVNEVERFVVAVAEVGLDRVDEGFVDAEDGHRVADVEHLNDCTGLLLHADIVRLVGALDDDDAV